MCDLAEKQAVLYNAVHNSSLASVAEDLTPFARQRRVLLSDLVLVRAGPPDPAEAPRFPLHYVWDGSHHPHPQLTHHENRIGAL